MHPKTKKRKLQQRLQRCTNIRQIVLKCSRPNLEKTIAAAYEGGFISDEFISEHLSAPKALSKGMVTKMSINNTATAESSGSFKMLSDEHIVDIFRFLGINDILVLSSTCKNLLGFLKIPLLTGSLTLTPQEGTTINSYYKNGLPTANRIPNGTFSSLPNILNLSHVTSLTVKAHEKTTKLDLIKSFFSAFPDTSLTVFNGIGNKFKDSKQLAQLLGQRFGQNLVEVSMPSGDTLATVLESAPKVRIVGCCSLDNETFSKIARANKVARQKLVDPKYDPKKAEPAATCAITQLSEGSNYTSILHGDMYFRELSRNFPELEVLNAEQLDRYCEPKGIGTFNFYRSYYPDDWLPTTALPFTRLTTLHLNIDSDAKIDHHMNHHAVGFRRFISKLSTMAPVLIDLKVWKRQKPRWHSKKDGPEPYRWHIYISSSELAHPALKSIELHGITLTSAVDLTLDLKKNIPNLESLSINIIFAGNSDIAYYANKPNVTAEMEASISEDKETLSLLESGVDGVESKVVTTTRTNTPLMPVECYAFFRYGKMPLSETFEALGDLYD